MSAKTAADIRANDFRTPEPPKWLQGLLHRTWFVLIPLIAVSWYRSKHVEPAVLELEKSIAQEQFAGEEQRGKILSQRQRVSVEMSMLTALADTFAARFEQIDAVIDSVRTLQQADVAEKRDLEAQIDSLRAIYSQAAGLSKEKSSELALLQARVDSLRTVIAARDEEQRRLASEAQSNREIMERVLFPDRFRNTGALITGAGRFPNRDSLPRR